MESRVSLGVLVEVAQVGELDEERSQHAVVPHVKHRRVNGQVPRKHLEQPREQFGDYPDGAHHQPVGWVGGVLETDSAELAVILPPSPR